MQFTLRDYQKAAVDAAMSFVKYRSGHGYITAPGGSGKSIMIAKLAELLVDIGFQVVVLARNEKLLTQNKAKLSPSYQERAGIYCAGLGFKEDDKLITIASAQSIYGVTLPKIEDRELIALVDECDEINPDSEGETQYWQFFRNNGNPRIIGFTATPFRLSSGAISWGEEIIRIPLDALIKKGHIVPPVNKASEVDLSSVPVTSLGDYSAPHLDEIYDDPDLLKVSMDLLLKYAHDRHHVLVFCQSLKHCDAVTNALEYANEGVRVVSGDTPKDELSDILEDFQRGCFKFLVNCQLLTVGVDLPCVDMIALFMATKSKRKFEQAVYRGTRPYPQKDNFLLLDMGNNLYEHGALGSPIRDKKKRKEQLPQQGKICPQCETWMEQALARECPDCGFQFPESELAKVRHAYEADNTSVAYHSEEKIIQRYEVFDVTYKQKKSKSGNEMIVVEYHCDYGKYGTIAEFLLPHHESDFVQSKARSFFSQRGIELFGDLRGFPMIELLDKAENSKKPTSIIVDHSEEWPRVKFVYFDEPKSESVMDSSEVLDGDEILF
jgi:DNA repair protein RadD